MSARTVEQAAAIVELSNALGKWKVTNDAINACLEYLQANYPKLPDRGATVHGRE